MYDVIIAGAGPVGLFLGCELALANCKVLILEKADRPGSILKKLPFGMRGLTAPSIEALNYRGLLQEMKIPLQVKNPFAGNTPIQQRPGGHFAGIQFHLNQVDTSQWKYRLPITTDFNLMSEMEELESTFTRKALSLGVTILRGTPITSFEQTTDEVIILANNETFTAKWLVGCDGSRSVVRKIGGFEFAGTEPEFTGYTVKVAFEDPSILKMGRVLTPTGMYFQHQPGYLGIQDYDGGAFHNAGTPITREHIQAVLRRISNTNVTITNVEVATTWTDRARQATQYRKGRVLLAGDAAHIHSPLGGQGLNLGLGDAMNVGWKLAATIHGTAPAGLLDTYELERHPTGQQILDWSRAQVSIMRPTAAAHALNAILRDIMNTRDGATYFAGRIWGLQTHYQLNGDHPLTGYSVPNFNFEDGTLMSAHMEAGKGILLNFAANTSLQKFAQQFEHQVKYLTIPANDQLGLHTLLIRPDGIVAFACDEMPIIEALEQATLQWFTA
ncbi:2-polyprenyl-6-methoxyphenol hydroxylase-like FAD-dependent oxidoreductase [Chitinophaga skermanii]|uniref:2-polyprenyl-6-methoxyphenol hydroxylase-like FAD-dependent oxidoreductase n=1 Tax=Chitinophaga skermanii TaxID=331697 RepID=A0A327QVL1_9BACT|nr:FAD-dependent monooxygenase [Chitinophaga skermanii]RAJ08639.1 2-polyprenyl-6-methoxyphenol hydroxylase-like FAD-dependent oxidoreductase [Chitinophaga skermanii]